MTPVAEKNSYLEAWQALPRGGPAWLAALRERAMGRFGELGFPTTRDEEWRFTNVAPIARVPFAPSVAARLEKVPFALPGASTILFVNGRLVSAERLPEGVKLLTPEEAEPHLGRYAKFDDHAFAALNTAFLEGGAFLQVARNQVVDRPIHVLFVATGAGVTYPRTLVVAGANSQAAVLETYIGAGEEVYFTNAVSEFVAEDNAVVEHCKLQLEGPQAFHVAVSQARVGHGANFTSHSISLGGALVRNDAGAVLAEGSEATLNGLYVAGGRQHVDNHTAIDHAKPHAASHELYKGILDGHASAVFNGKIYVRPDAQKTDAKQTNKNLVLSEDAVINTKPELQIWADDVRCTHGATIGQIDAESIFYLQSRGIGREQARSILTAAFAGDIVERVRNQAIRARLEGVLAERL